MKKITYFENLPNAPKPLEKSVLRTVRFNEIDPMGIMWHGHYASYLEDARLALGNAYGIGYQDFYNNGILIPVRQMHIDYLSSLYFGKTYEIKAKLFYSEAAKLNFDFTILDESKNTMARGYTVQLMVDKEKNLLFEWPTFTHKFLDDWKTGKLN